LWDPLVSNFFLFSPLSLHCHRWSGRLAAGVPCSGRPLAGDPCSGRPAAAVPCYSRPVAGPHSLAAALPCSGARPSRAPAGELRPSGRASSAGRGGLPCAGRRPRRAPAKRARRPPLRRSPSHAPVSSGQAGGQCAGTAALPCAGRHPGELRPSRRGGLPCAGRPPLRRHPLPWRRKRIEMTSGSPPEIYKKSPHSWVCLFFDLITCMLCHVITDSGVCLSKIMLIDLNRTISAHWNKFAQNRCFFAISSNTGGSKYFTRKCGGFLKLTQF
jgi:hypothetical protein